MSGGTDLSVCGDTRGHVIVATLVVLGITEGGRTHAAGRDCGMCLTYALGYVCVLVHCVPLA